MLRNGHCKLCNVNKFTMSYLQEFLVILFSSD